MSKLIDMTGQKFGRLLVIERADYNSDDRHAMWKCICDCGRVGIYNGKELRRGRIKSCGCSRQGLKFGRLTVLNRLQNNKCLCLCDCGNLTVVHISNLGNTKSCGCLHYERIKQSPAKTNQSELSMTVFADCGIPMSTQSTQSNTEPRLADVKDIQIHMLTDLPEEMPFEDFMARIIQN